MVTKQFSIFQMYQKMDMPIPKLMFGNRNIAAFYLEPMVQIPLPSKQTMQIPRESAPQTQIPRESAPRTERHLVIFHYLCRE